MHSLTMLAASAIFAALASSGFALPVLETDPPIASPIFVPSPRYPCFRQPAILAVGAKLLAFSENRNVSECAPEAVELRQPDEVGSLLLRISVDSAATWGAMKTVPGTVGNIDFYSIVYDAKAKKITLLLQDKGVTVLSSSDAGTSWTREAPLDLEGLSKGGIAVSKPAVGHGIQVQPHLCPGGCKNAGRLIVPMVCTNKTASGSHGDKGCITCNSCLLISDDSAKTWRLGAVGQQGTRESQIVQLPSTQSTAALYATERNMGAHPGHRQYAFSADSGVTYATTGTDATLTGPVTAHWTGIVGSINGIRNATTLVYAGPASPTLRQDMAIHTSATGHSWSAGKTLWSGFAGYSDLAASPDGNGLVLIFENGKQSFADYVSVAKIPALWLPAAAV